MPTDRNGACAATLEEAGVGYVLTVPESQQLHATLTTGAELAVDGGGSQI